MLDDGFRECHPCIVSVRASRSQRHHTVYGWDTAEVDITRREDGQRVAFVPAATMMPASCSMPSSSPVLCANLAPGGTVRYWDSGGQVLV